MPFFRIDKDFCRFIDKIRHPADKLFALNHHVPFEPVKKPRYVIISLNSALRTDELLLYGYFCTDFVTRY